MSLRAPGAGFGLAVVAGVVALALVGPALVPGSPTRQDHDAVLAPPGGGHLLGTDELGRDLLTRLVYGVRPSLAAGAIAVGLALVLGVPMGLLAGHSGGWLDEVLMRVADALWSFPGLVLAIAVAAILGPGLANAMVAIGIVYAPVFARLVRGQTVAVREHEYVEAARAVGASDPRIMARYVWPNVSPPVLVQSSLMLGQAILFEAALSFLGLGVQPPAPAWGSMLRTAYQYIEVDPWYALFPGAAIFVTVLAFNLLGDGLREALDPRLRGHRGETA
jgi:peptide/nickel transport system permease protein